MGSVAVMYIYYDVNNQLKVYTVVTLADVVGDYEFVDPLPKINLTVVLVFLFSVGSAQHN